MVDKIVPHTTTKFWGSRMIRSVSSLGSFRAMSVSSSIQVVARNVSSLRFCSEYNDYMKKIQNKSRFSCKDLSIDQSVPIGSPPGQLPWVSEKTKSKAICAENSRTYPDKILAKYKSSP